jgi:hypothetical protein
VLLFFSQKRKEQKIKKTGSSLAAAAAAMSSAKYQYSFVSLGKKKRTLGVTVTQCMNFVFFST